MDSQSKSHAWVAGQVPRRGRPRGNHAVVFLSLSCSFSFPLSKSETLKGRKLLWPSQKWKLQGPAPPRGPTQFPTRKLGDKAPTYPGKRTKYQELTPLSPVVGPSPLGGTRFAFFRGDHTGLFLFFYLSKTCFSLALISYSK